MKPKHSLEQKYAVKIGLFAFPMAILVDMFDDAVLNPIWPLSSTFVFLRQAAILSVMSFIAIQVIVWKVAKVRREKGKS